MIKKLFIFMAILSVVQPGTLLCQQQSKNIVLVTLDGFRWEELFGGAVDSLMTDPLFAKDSSELKSMFDGSTRSERREKLMPWFWKTLSKKGQIYGNRWLGNTVRCSNIFLFSYPGYNEILTGFSDPKIDSNDKVYNHNMTVLEWMHQSPNYKNNIAAFASWDVFPYIINDKRSGIPVNAGFRKSKDEHLTQREIFLNELQDEIPSPWSSVRLDAFTHHYMMEYMAKHHPKVLYIGYGETDDFAHDGSYDHYLKSAHQTDKWIEQLWLFLQSDPFYKNQTTLLITTDHGRGNNPKSEWIGHGKTYKGSEYIWMAVIGPDTPALGEVKTKTRILQNQFAKTAAAFLGLNYINENQEVGPVISTMFKQ